MEYIAELEDRSEVFGVAVLRERRPQVFAEVGEGLGHDLVLVEDGAVGEEVLAFGVVVHDVLR